uniref:Large ribosomal subunit protein bL25 n=1 Tax=Acetithermum autotrophicum TaxID=1446466 RepID=H5SRK3_ACEAU|nr:50S ribosomal protein L25/general stress protein Ctc [Candidatus Acetothermum autotrophicum]
MSYTVHVEPRGSKPNPRALRRQGRIPGVLYGHEVHHPIAVDAKELEKLLARITRSSRITLIMDGKQLPAFIKEIQYDPLTDRVIHIDFYHPAPDRPVTIDVPVRLHGEPAGRKEGGVLQLLRDVVKVRGPMDAIPEIIEIDVTNLGIGQAVHVNELKLEGVQVLTPGEATIVTVVAPRKEEVAVAAAPGVEGVVPAEGAAPAEGATPAAGAAPAAAEKAAAAPAKAEEKKPAEKGKEKAKK